MFAGITGTIEYRTLDIASYIVLHHGTVRMAAEAYCISKSSVHGYMRKVLPKLDPELYTQVDTVFHENWNMKHIRGGEATARKYAEMRAERNGS